VFLRRVAQHESRQNPFNGRTQSRRLLVLHGMPGKTRSVGTRLSESQQHPQRRTRRLGREVSLQAKLLRVTDPRAAIGPRV
jgi:hypothetical protein